MNGINDWSDVFHSIMDELKRLRTKKQRYLTLRLEDEAAKISNVLATAPRILSTHNVQEMKTLLEMMKEL